MARVQIDPNPYILTGANEGMPNPNYGVAPPATVDLSVGADDVVYDIFIGNQGEGALDAELNWTAGDFVSVFMPPHAHRDSVTLSPGDIITLDSLENLQLVVTRLGGSTATSTFSTTGRKTHITSATSANDYVVVGVGSRS